MIIRDARATDAVGMARVNVESWKSAYAGVVPQDYLDSVSFEQRVSTWQARLSDPSKIMPGWFYIVAEEDKAIIGLAGGGPERSGSKTYTGEIGAIYLLKSHQGRGVGHQLITAVALRLKKQGHNSMLVWVLRENPYRAFYEALGGKQFAQRQINIGGADLIEVAYGWRDLSIFKKTVPTPAAENPPR
jgi:GNAT superfamily N-acetyltransferase